MWEKDELWNVYSNEFETVESSRDDWVDKALDYLIQLTAEQNEKGSGDILFKTVEKDDKVNANFQFYRRTDDFPLGNNYKARVIIGFDSFSGRDTCQFFTKVWVRLKNRNQIRNAEKRVVLQFVKDQKDDFPDAQIVPGKDDRFYFTLTDTTDPDFDIESGHKALSETYDALEDLGARLDQYYSSES